MIEPSMLLFRLSFYFFLDHLHLEFQSLNLGTLFDVLLDFQAKMFLSSYCRRQELIYCKSQMRYHCIPKYLVLLHLMVQVVQVVFDFKAAVIRHLPIFSYIIFCECPGLRCQIVCHRCGKLCLQVQLIFYLVRLKMLRHCKDLNYQMAHHQFKKLYNLSNV